MLIRNNNDDSHSTVASLSKDDTTPVNDNEHFIRDISLTGIGNAFKEKSPLKDNVAAENEYVKNELCRRLTFTSSISD